MKKLLAILFISFLFITNANSACDDPPGDGVDYSGCAFSDGQDLTGTFMPNSNLSFTGFIKVIFEIWLSPKIDFVLEINLRRLDGQIGYS